MTDDSSAFLYVMRAEAELVTEVRSRRSDASSGSWNLVSVTRGGSSAVFRGAFILRGRDTDDMNYKTCARRVHRESYSTRVPSINQVVLGYQYSSVVRK